MFVRSDTLTVQNIRDAFAHARVVGYDILIDDDGVREFRPRAFAHGFEFWGEALSGPRARNGRPGKAASWDAYGVAMAYLYVLDPSARIAHYKDAEDFANQTASYVPDGCSAPWLTDPYFSDLLGEDDSISTWSYSKRVARGEIIPTTTPDTFPAEWCNVTQ